MSAAKRRVLDVGQCRPDHQAISSLIEERFGAEVDRAESIDSALERLQCERYDLVLVNRIIDRTSDEGTSMIERMMATPSVRDVPVMLISNFESAQRAAVALGAQPGFGKADLNSEQTLERLDRYLGSTSPA